MTNKIKESEIRQTVWAQSRVKQLVVLEGRIPILRYLSMDGTDTDYANFWRTEEELVTYDEKKGKLLTTYLG